MPRQRLAPERRIVLQQVIDIPNPVILLSRASTFAIQNVLGLGNGRPIDAGNGVQRRAHGHRLARAEYMRYLPVHGQSRGRTTALTYLFVHPSRETKVKSAICYA